MVDQPAGDDWFDLFKSSDKPDGGNYDQITDNIFLGGYTAAENLKTLKEIMKVDAILTVADNLEPKFSDDFKYKIIEISDDPESNLKQHLLECIEFIDEKVKSGNRIYVHCAAGVSRSASTVLAYIMVTQQIGLNDAYKIVSAKRPCIKPNDGFVAQLKLFEQDLRNEGRIK